MKSESILVKFATIGILYLVLGYFLGQALFAETVVTNVCETLTPECAYDVTPGSVMTLEAEPEPDSFFVGWLGEVCSGTRSICIFTMPKKNIRVTAVFDLIPQHNLYLEVYGLEGGVVISSPAGIYCKSNTQCEAKFGHGQKVILTASPPSGRYITWKGFSGCSGQGPCTIIMTTSKAGNIKFR